MSVKEVTFYTVVCDRCGKDGNADYEYTAWNDAEGARNVAEEWDDWLVVDGDLVTWRYYHKHYCPDCWAWSEDGEEQVPKP